MSEHRTAGHESTWSKFAGMVGAADLVIFDFDGVISDSEVISLTTLRETLNAFGLDLTAEEIREMFLGTSLKTIAAHVAEHGTGDTDAFPEQWESALFKRFRAELRPVPHVLDLVNRLQQNGTAFCIASSSTFNRIDIALDAMGVTDRFAHIFSAQQVARGKPAPDLFEYAARKMGVTPAACLVVEHSPHGVRAAGAAGMSAGGFSGRQHLVDLQAEHSAALLAAGAEFVLPSFEGFARMDMTG